MALKLFPSVWSKHVGAENIAKALVTPISELKQLPFWKQLEKAIKDSDNNPPNERYYYFAKKVVHASSYGMKANTFRMALLKESGGTIVISLKDAEEYLNTFHREFPEIQLWHFEVYNTVTKNKQLRNLFGFPYNITNYINQHDYKDLIAWIPQSTVACITRQAYVRLQEYIESNNKNWHLLNDEHDSYMQEVPDNDTEEGARIMKSLIEIELESPVDKTKFRMKSEVQYGKVWAHESETNKDGLKEFAL
jgi:DNA polymerase I-like protein with 3'-5' exonuclease and polymerase domains